jgi:hypothetical protein
VTRWLGAQRIDIAGNGLFQNVAIEKKNGGERLILGRCGYGLRNGEVREEGFDFRFAHRAWVALVMEKDESLDPSYISLFSGVGVVLEADLIANPVKQFARFCVVIGMDLLQMNHGQRSRKSVTNVTSRSIIEASQANTLHPAVYSLMCSISSAIYRRIIVSQPYAQPSRVIG